MRLFNTTFVANKAGVEGAAIMSVGLLEELSNVSFTENTYFCRTGEYGHIAKSKASKKLRMHIHAASGEIVS